MFPIEVSPRAIGALLLGKCVASRPDKVAVFSAKTKTQEADVTLQWQLTTGHR